MIKMVVDAEFVLVRDSGEIVNFVKGEVDMLEADAKHWYTLLFAKPVAEVVAVVETKAAKGK